MTTTRRLAAILAADVAGYSRLIGADEGSTLRRLRAIRDELIDPTADAHQGRLVKMTGDGLLVEFGSVVSALQCATEIQAGMAERNSTVLQDQRIEFRIGPNVGDIVVEDGDIFGDGVNIAARLEALAEPGGICVPARVQEDAAGKLDLSFEDLGERQLRNIARPVRVYALRPEAIAKLIRSETSPRSSKSLARGDPRVSIVVLPFVNLSDDREQQHLTDGVTEDITSDLSRMAGLHVISRNTAFTYRNKPVNAKQIGRELSVRYVLEGSVRRFGSHLRVSGQLVEADTDAHLWAERFDCETTDPSRAVNDVAGRIARAIQLELVNAEAGRPNEHPDALDFLFRGRAAIGKAQTREGYASAIRFFERALASNPGWPEAQGWLANTLVARALDLMSDTPYEDLERSYRLASDAVAAAPRSWIAHQAKAQALRAQRRWEEAILEYERVIEIDQSYPTPYAQLGGCILLARGSMDEAAAMVEQALRLSPRDPSAHNWHSRLGLLEILRSRPDQAVHFFERARNANPLHSQSHAGLASAYGLMAETVKASAALAEAHKLSEVYASVALLRRLSPYADPNSKVRDLFETIYLTGLRKAGLPEE